MQQGLWNLMSDGATAIAALTAVAAVILESRASRRTLGAETYRQLEEKFFHTALMRKLRRRAAEELRTTSAENGPPDQRCDAFCDLADFFDHIGILLRRGVLDDEMAWSSFYRRAASFWDAGNIHGILGKARDRQPLRWNEYEYLLRKLERVHARKTRSFSGCLTTEEREAVLAQELELPEIDREI
jgi:hypothetical protein